MDENLINKMSKRHKDILKAIENSLIKSGRLSNAVKLLLASKTIAPDIIKQATLLDCRLFGENKAQELQSKLPQLEDQNIEWHFIGHLQSNKVKDVVPYCRLIHSLDRISLAKELEKQAVKSDIKINALIEVNTSKEETKSGLAPKDVLEFCKQMQNFEHIQIKGLMTLAVNSTNTERVRDCFKSLKTCSLIISQAQLEKVTMEELSMGMSQDYTIAIEEGSTLIRLGSAFFGPRQ